MLRRHAASAFALALLIFGNATAIADPNSWGYKAYNIMNTLKNQHSDLVMLAAHRGIHALWNDYQYQNIPENSLQSIYNAADNGIEMVEVDVRLTQDGVPILSHDSTWGRNTNVGAAWNACCFNPWGPLPGLSVPDGDPGELGGGVNSPYDPQRAVNPNVSDWSRASVQDGYAHLVLRNSMNFSWSTWSEAPPTLQNVLDYIRSNRLNIVVAIDIKDGNAMQAAWRVVAANRDYNGNPYYQTVFFKFDAAWVFPWVGNFRGVFATTFYGKGWPYSDDYVINILPVFQTSGISPGLYGSEGLELEAVKEYANFSDNVVGVEVNYKQSNGILSSLLGWMRSNKWWRALGNFNPYAEWIDPNDSYHTYRFFYSNGYCCAVPRDWFYNGSSSGAPSDTDDRRLDWHFLLDEGNGFNIITTDNVLPMAQYLWNEGRRNTSYYK